MSITYPFAERAMGQNERKLLNAMWRDLQALKTNGPDQLGWADYSDMAYESPNPAFSVTADALTTIPNDGLDGNRTQLPTGRELFNVSENKFEFNLHESFLITLEMTLTPTESGPVYADLWFYSGSIAPDRYRTHMNFDKGSGVPHRISHTIYGYACQSCATNGLLPQIQSTKNVDLSDIRFLVELCYKPPTT